MSQKPLSDIVDCVGPVGVDADFIHVRDDEQRRIVQRQRILLQLGQRCGEVLAPALVLPGEVVFPPHIGPAVAAGGFAGTLLEGEPFALGIGGHGINDVEQAANVVEVRLGGRAFFQFNTAPFFDEG